MKSGILLLALAALPSFGGCNGAVSDTGATGSESCDAGRCPGADATLSECDPLRETGSSLDLVADVDGGDELVLVNRPSDGSVDAFYGPAGHLVQATVEHLIRSKNGSQYLSFRVGGRVFTANFSVYSHLTDAGLVSDISPGELVGDDGTSVPLTWREPTPISLPDFRFFCL